MKLHQAVFILVALVAGSASAGVQFDVRIDPAATTQPITGRLVVYVKPIAKPLQEFNDDRLGAAEDYFGVHARELIPNELLRVDDAAACFPHRPGDLPEGEYLGRRCSIGITTTATGAEPWNPYSAVTRFRLAQESTVELSLNRVVSRLPIRRAVAPKYLRFARSCFRIFIIARFISAPALFFRSIEIRIGQYPTVYDVPGFGGDGISIVNNPPATTQPPAGELARQAFHIYLDPESGNGHTLFCQLRQQRPVRRCAGEGADPGAGSEDTN